MVTLSQAIASNNRVATTFPAGLVAIFVGGTSGVGEYTIKALSKHALNPRIYIIGRSEEAAARIIQECQQTNSGGKYTFIKSDVSILKNVDKICTQIKQKETTINILFLTQATMAFSKTTSENLPLASSLITHSRTRFVLNLLPLLQTAPSLRRVVSVGAASFEGPIDLSNIHGVGFPLHQSRDQTASIQTLLLEEVARRAPDVSFVHDVPGVVKGGIMRDMEPTFKLSVLVAVAGLLGPLIRTSPYECGERHVFLATSARYAPRRGGESVAGVSLDKDLEVARGSDGQAGSGIYTLNAKCESSSAQVEELLEGFRKDGTADKVWEHVRTDFVRITGTEIAS